MAVFQSQNRLLLSLDVGLVLLVPVTTLLYVLSYTFKCCHVRYDKKQSVTDQYEDEDGVAGDQSRKRRRCLGPICISVVAAAVGFVAVVWNGSSMFASTASIQDLVKFCAQVAVWSLNLMSTISLVVISNSPSRYCCGLACACGHLTACLFSTLQVFYIHGQRREVFLGLVQIAASFIACISSLSIPRRPDVRYAGRTVDQFHTVSALNRWTLAWAVKILSLARSNGKLELKDFPLLHRKARSDYLLSHSILGKSQSPLWKALLHSYWQPLVVQSIYGAVQPLLQFAPTVLLYALLRNLEDKSTRDASTSAVLITALGITLTLAAWIDVWLRWLGFATLALQIRSELSALIYAKATRCTDGAEAKDDSLTDGSSTPEKDSAQGGQRAINLMAIDVQRSSDFIQSHFLFLQTTLSLILSAGFLWKLLGWQSLLAGLAMFLLILPFNVWSSKKSTAAQVQLMAIKDQKLASLTEALRGIRQIKFFAEEDQWQTRLYKVRQAELNVQWLVYCYETVLIGCYNFGPIALSAAALTAYAVIHGDLSASVAFTSITVFSVMESSLAVIPQYTAIGIEAWISLRRIEDYLKSPEKSDYLTVGDHIAFKKATISWQASNYHTFMLRDVNLTIPNGALTVVSGSTGSGKSLFLASIIGEAYLLSGRVTSPRLKSPILPPHESNWIIDSAVAFVAQTPWLENATIRDNILFGLPWKKARYDKVVDFCALKYDLQILPDGDLTELGVEGINLSGGQKWRVSFARALYSRAGILVIDDLFSAVDAPVARHLLDNALLGEFGANRTRILVTHHMDLCISHAELVIFLEKGRVVYNGSPEGWNKESTQSVAKLSLAGPDEETATDEAEVSKKTARKFLEEETKDQGSIKFATYLTYFRSSGGIIHWFPILALFVSHQGLLLGRSWFVGYWTQSDTKKLHNSSQPRKTYIGDQSLNYYIGVYVGLSLCLCVTAALRYFLIYMRSIKASRTMFESLVFSILRAPLRWLDTVPMGRILNRFSSDFQTIDSQLGTQLGAMVYCILQILGTIIAATFVSPWILVVVVILFLSCAIINSWYLFGAREVKRLESIARSPTFELFSSTLSGIATIRTFGRTDTYIRLMLQRIEDHARALWYLWLFHGWVTFRLNLIGTIFTVAVAVFVLYSDIDASLAGFALSFVLQYSPTVCLLTRLYSNVELAMNSVERISEYTNLTIEDQTNSTSEVSAAWPLKGHVEVSGLVAGYSSELPSILNGLTFSIAPNERVGVVGRTGAGKSSLVLALLRFLDVRAGSIQIDGVDIAHVPLPVLRSRLTMIPQDPILFSGTVRSNLDNFDACDDTELLNALQRVNISCTPGVQDLTLDTTVSECGLNLSQGQRQLLCLARAIVRRPKILILDEATSAVDFATDQFIQRSIRSEFTDSTLIVIAHRLSTVADFDKVLVMEDGRAVEFGRPRDLLLKTEGKAVFRDMVDNSGDGESIRSVIMSRDPTMG